eukprot:TRINITY_DN9890_c0_g2_i1.p1 TRINITY_DN9890_c0_g2~~TRINITY_DN9890_c0_g2_i1.p1  ORF type:complete len:218 (+),score=77.80 TRINITY_DN9890_c0_g2_i1:147-800(+)
MGMCCAKGSSKKNEGIIIAVDETLSTDYTDKKTMAKDDLRILLNKISVLEYNTKLYDKRSLQAQRAKGVKIGVNERYVELVRETKKLEDEVSAAVKAQVLEEYKVPSESFESALLSPDATEVSSAALMNLFKAIRESRQKLGLNEAATAELGRNYESTYHRCNFMLNSSPAIAKDLSELYGDNQHVNYLDVIVADSLYYEYNLLPVELMAFIDDSES